jgi:EAL domain-containing protein (putative c-di-GMP-specific phosphodiesterase class I)
MGSRFDAREAKVARPSLTQVSGVHESPTSPAPYIEELEGTDLLLGSIPRSALSCLFQPITTLVGSTAIGVHAQPMAELDELADGEELFARAIIEKRVGELGRALREIALREAGGMPVFLPVHPSELREAWLVRPDDPITTHDADVFIEISQPLYSTVCMQVLDELRSRSGVGLVLDDFGGFGSHFAQAVELSPAFVKIAAELVRGLAQSAAKQACVRAIASACADMGIHVIAKGLDSVSDMRAAQQCGVEYGQGLVFGAPQPAAVVMRRIVSRQLP